MATFTPKSLQNGFEMLWKWKNHHLLTLGSIEIDWRIVWSPRLILRIPYAPNKSPKAIRGIKKHTNNFFMHSELKHAEFLRACFGGKHANFHHFWRKILRKYENRLPMDVCAHQNILRRRMITPNTSLNSLWPAQHFTNLSSGRTMR